MIANMVYVMDTYKFIKLVNFKLFLANLMKSDMV